MTNGKPCESLEKEYEEAWKKWEAAKRADLAARPGPPGAITGSLAAIDLRRRYDDCAIRLREFYEKHDVPENQRLRVREIPGSEHDRQKNP
jgi:hypothetical protein